MKFTWEFCEMCGAYFIRCPKCGNNCCNGGCGEINGVQCDVCELCYQFQELSYQNNLEPKITEEDAKKILAYQEKLDEENDRLLEDYCNKKLKN